MADELSFFPWSIAEAGYEWIDAPVSKRLGEPGTLASALVARNGGARIYEPLRSTRLMFPEFARAEMTSGGVLKFASKYGFLGLPGFVTPLRTVQRGELLG